jgi:hypothetical protein
MRWTEDIPGSVYRSGSWSLVAHTLEPRESKSWALMRTRDGICCPYAERGDADPTLAKSWASRLVRRRHEVSARVS